MAEKKVFQKMSDKGRLSLPGEEQRGGGSCLHPAPCPHRVFPAGGSPASQMHRPAPGGHPWACADTRGRAAAPPAPRPGAAGLVGAAG